MDLSYFHCELCGSQLLQHNNFNKNKFPIVRRFKDNDETKALLTVRCAECDNIPYCLKEGNPSRSRRFNVGDISSHTKLV